jgi:hypothetical protein
MGTVYLMCERYDFSFLNNNSIQLVILIIITIITQIGNFRCIAYLLFYRSQSTKDNINLYYSIIILIITIISGGVDNWLKRRSTGKRKHVIS